ncbi:hypothetical protein GBF38_008439 [Nibea albiflora]|uniref:Uncharacterized protein n=1 Tax=Nibea albiflora TaxID=240163 RepID=A0ACB7ETS6_NIBAL|nr:hypothetical protein GBF38_008439 [Nibea albiflora]
MTHVTVPLTAKPRREVGSDTVPFLPTHILPFLPAHIHKQRALTATAHNTEPTTEPQTMKVFNKKRAEQLMIFASAIPGEEDDGQSPPATGSTALYWCHEKTEAALHRPIKLYQQLAGCPPQPCSLSISLSVSLCLNLSASLCIFHSNARSPVHRLGPRSSSCGTTAHERERESPSPYSLPGDKYLPHCPDLFWVN